MGLRLTLITSASTAATAAAAFSDGDEPLDGRGVQRVEQARLLIGRHDAALTGPSPACRQTAHGLGLSAEVDVRLREWDHGCWRGRRLDDVAATDPAGLAAWMSDPGATPHGGESLTDLLARVAAWLADQPAAGSLTAVVPIAIVRAAVVHVSDAPAVAIWRHEPGPLTATVLRGTPPRWAVRVMGLPLASRQAVTALRYW